MTLCFVLVDLSTPAMAGPEHGGPIPAGWLQAVASALRLQLNVDFARYWGGAYSVRAATDPSDVAPGDVVLAIVDERPESPNAVAAHGADGSGKPVGFASRAMCATLDDLTTAISHEILEVAVDPDVNDWCDDDSGYSVAKEPCDPVESTRYRINGVAVSDFVLPAWFTIGAVGPYSFTRTTEGLAEGAGYYPAAPFALARGGYYVRREVGSGQVDIFGELVGRARTEKLKATGRTRRRGVTGTNGIRTYP